MKVQSVRFGPTQWALIRLQAQEEGVSASQFIRDAAFARALVHIAVQRPAEALAIADLIGEPRQRAAFEEYVQGLSRLLADTNGD